MIGRTLGTYFAARFLRSIAILFGFAFVIIFLFDFLELFRRSTDRPNATVSLLLIGSLMRVPSICEQVLPFATLFGAMAAFLGLSRSLELVVARSAGVSVWQFTAPALAVALGLGTFATAVYNPAAVYLKDSSDELMVSVFGRQQRVAQQSSSDAWLRQDGRDGESIMHAVTSLEQGLRLLTVTVTTFNRQGRFNERIDASEARFQDGAWTLTNAKVQSAGAAPQTFDTYLVATNLTREQIRESLASPESVSFWALAGYVATARNAGLPSFGYELQFQTLLARPLLLAAMVLIAGTVSLRVFRFGNIGRLILSGVTAGFVLYVLGEIARDLGGVGIVPPVVAAWVPAVVASLMGFTILLYQEDG
jgi:lipopolysaccharide export system permease protein